MFGFNPKPQRANAPIAARTINVNSKQAQKSARLSVGPGLALTHIAGIPLVRRDDPTEYVVRITSVGSGANAGKYAWRAIQPNPATPGAWIDRDARLAGTIADDPLYEYNLNATLTVGFRVKARRVLGEMRTLYGRCS